MVLRKLANVTWKHSCKIFARMEFACVFSIDLLFLINRQVFFAGHIPQVTTTGHSIFAPKQHKKTLNSANRTRQALMYIFSKNMFRLGAQLL